MVPLAFFLSEISEISEFSEFSEISEFSEFSEFSEVSEFSEFSEILEDFLSIWVGIGLSGRDCDDFLEKDLIYLIIVAIFAL